MMLHSADYYDDEDYAPTYEPTQSDITVTEAEGENNMDFRVDIDQKSIEDKVAQIMANRLLKTCTAEIHKAVLDSVMDTIQGAVVDMVREHVNKPVQKRNCFGEPEGEAKTLSQLIAEEFEAKLKGNKSSGSIYSRNRETTYLQDLVKDNCISGLEMVAKETITDMKAEATKQVQESIKELVSAQLIKMSK